MDITVDRYKSTPPGTPGATLSRVLVDGEPCVVGLEDEYRAVKVKGETRIPAGRYKISVRTFGDFHSRYSQRFSDFHKGMLEVMNVPGFTDILIHIGNFEHNTEGCLLVGMTANEGNMTIGSSAVAYKKLYKKVIAAALAGELYIEYIDNDRPLAPTTKPEPEPEDESERDIFSGPTYP